VSLPVRQIVTPVVVASQRVFHTDSPNRTQPVPDESNPFRAYTITASNFKDLQVKLSVRLHKDQVNQCHFIHTPNQQLPLVASVSNDNWLKIYSLDEKSLFRSHNVADFSLSSVDSALHTPDRTLLFLSCWDNGLYIYDMNYNRCVFSLPNAHEDAVSRVRVIDLDADTKVVLTSSWDSLIKAWLVPLRKETLKARFITELAFESSVVDFQVSKAHLAAICDDGNAHVWRLDVRKLVSK